MRHKIDTDEVLVFVGPPLIQPAEMLPTIVLPPKSHPTIIATLFFHSFEDFNIETDCIKSTWGLPGERKSKRLENCIVPL